MGGGEYNSFKTGTNLSHKQTERERTENYGNTEEHALLCIIIMLFIFTSVKHAELGMRQCYGIMTKKMRQHVGKRPKYFKPLV